VSRTATCDRQDAVTRLTHARKFLEVAELVAPDFAEGNANVAASLAVLAGIAASDSLCCFRLGRRSRSQDHHDAESLLQQIVPEGHEAAQRLRRLLDLKDSAHYGVIHLSRGQLKTAMRQAATLVELAGAARN
jgi:hypothetical protein